MDHPFAYVTLLGVLGFAVACGGNEEPKPARPKLGAQGGSTGAAGARTDGFTGLRIVAVSDATPALDPGAGLWSSAPTVEVVLQPQVLAMPRLTRATVTGVGVQAVHDADRVAIRMSWRDGSKDKRCEQDTFPDACAVMLPVDQNPSFMMGQKDARVQILHWKALWQRDIDEGFQDVQDLHPNFWMDSYWFAKGGWPYPVPAAFADPRARAWFPARQAGNPMSVWDREKPVQELFAEGFGTLTVQDEDRNQSDARGAWVSGTWTVVFVRPLRTADEVDHAFGGGQELIGFAVWDGSADNVGGRKHYSVWYPYRLEDR